MKPIPPQTAGRIRKLREQGFTHSGIAQRLGISPNTVRTYLIKAGMARAKAKKIDWPSHTALLRGKTSSNDIAAALGCSVSAVQVRRRILLGAWNTPYCRRPNKVRAPLSQSRYFDYRGYLEKLLREAWERDFAEFEFDVWRRALKTPAGQRYLASLNVDDRLFEQKEGE